MNSLAKPIQQVAVCGLGLIGGSVVRALRAADRAIQVTGFDLDTVLMARLRAEGWIDAVAHDTSALFAAHDMVVLCQPVGSLLGFLRTHAGDMSAGRAVTVDVASVKTPVVAALERSEAAARFVPCHPIAGKATHGWDASEAGLFGHKRCILTPGAATDAAAVRQAQAFWALLGARTSLMDAAQHDTIYAALSHLPQLLTYAYLHGLASHEAVRAWLDYQGSGYRSFTRLGSSDAALWADIAVHNRPALLAEIDRLQESLTLLRRHLAHNDAAALRDCFERARSLHALGIGSPRPAAPFTPTQELR